GSGYRQAFFAYEKQRQYNSKKEEYTTKQIGCSFVVETLQNDKNIISGIATKPAYNDEYNQDDSFLRAIFWAY
ncbi:17002_t:CDS:2, partial [Racocetra fulgida]